MLLYLLVSSSSDCVRRAVPSTVTPLFAKATASSLPMPLLHPVMSANVSRFAMAQLVLWKGPWCCLLTIWQFIEHGLEV